MRKVILFVFFCTAALFSQWQNVSNGLWPVNGNQFNRQIKTIESHNGILFAANTYGHLAKSTDNGDNWEIFTVPGLPENPYVNIIYSTGTRLFLGLSNVSPHGIYYSDDNGATFTNAGGVSSITINNFYKKGDKIWATSQFLFVSTDNGATWSNIITGPWSVVGANPSAFAEDNSGNFYFGSTDRRLYKSSDNGVTWERIMFSGLDASSGGGFGDMTFYNGLILATYGGNKGVVYSSNGGVDWAEAGGFTSAGLKNASKFEKIGDQIIVGTALTTMLGDASGMNWSPLDPQDFNYFLGFTQQNNTLFGGKVSDGVYRRNLLSTSTEEEVGLITEYKLLQNYPNPFNPATTIEFNVAVGGNVELKLYDILGNEVFTLFNGYMNQGTHKINFNGEHLTSGIYLYRLNTGNFSSVKKLILLK
jgi:photosystem II stability/assembly factor-like uncharacterized protein